MGSPKVKDWRIILATALATAIAALVPSAVGWFKVRTLKESRQALRDNYGSYVEDTMKREEALERALMDCLVERHREEP
jgi:hypothetical protein